MNLYVKPLLAVISLFSIQIFAAKLAPVTVQNLSTKVVVDGQIEAITAATVSAQVSARVKGIYVDVNDTVTAGSLLVELDDTELQASLAKANASLNVALAQSVQATTEFNRLQGLESERFVSKNDMTRAISAVDVAKAMVNLAKAEIAEVKQLLTYTKITAPYSGIVTERHIELGEIASVGQPLLSGFKLNKNRLVVQVPNKLIPNVENLGFILVEAPVNNWVKLDGLTISPNTNPKTHTVMVRADITKNLLSVRPGSFVKAAVLTDHREAITVPSSAVFYQGDLAAVYVQIEETKVLRQVLVGGSNQGRIEVLSGLTKGDQVVADGAAYLANNRQPSVK